MPGGFKTMGDARDLGDVDPAVMREELHRMADWIADYREGVSARAISPTVQPGWVTEAAGGPVPEHGVPLNDITADLDRMVMPGILHWGHPAFLGYFGSSSNGPALLGEMAAAALNVSAMTWKTSPAATELESVVVKWIREIIGLPEDFQGIVYDTASVGLMHALAAAREQAGRSGGANIRRDGMHGRPVHRVYASDQAHSSIEKAAIVLGIGESNVVRIPCDSEFRMNRAALRRAIEEDAHNGFLPMAVIATIGTTSTASVDPVDAIADICEATGTWLHVDAAYGGALAALPEQRWIMAGVTRADSFIVNPHKWLFVPLDFSLLYVRDPALLRSVFSLVPEYLAGDASLDDAGAGANIDYMDYGIQLGRRFRALKAWYVLRAFGRDGIVARIREHCRLAALFTEWVSQENGFTVEAPTVMSVVCFRYRPSAMSEADADALNQKIVKAVNAGGQAYVTCTTLRGKSVVRVGFGNMQTTESDARCVWGTIVETARSIA